MKPGDFLRLRDLIQQKTGIYLRDGKHVMLAARLNKRLRRLAIRDFASYYSYLQRSGDSAEMRALINCVTTNKTSFFREAHHFTLLSETLRREWCQPGAAGGPRVLRGWSAACSTGEEPYSIAITLLESLRGRGCPTRGSGMDLASPSSTGGWWAEVVASDVDTEVLETADRGIYSEDRLDSVPIALRSSYFLRGKGEMEGMVRVKRDLRRMLNFRHLNLVDANWNIEGTFDFIFFRNALIYFERQTQEAVLRKLLRYLKPDGLLFLGHSEHIFWLNDLLAPVQNTVFRHRKAECPNA